MTPEQTVREFFDVVRSGREPSRAAEYMAPHVRAHQVQAEHPTTVERTPAQYAEHVDEMLAAWGPFTLTVDEVLAAGDKVYVRWTQHGRHVGEVGDYPPTGEPVIEVASCTYRVADGAIVEYWIQIDRAGITAQLDAARAAGGTVRAAVTGDEGRTVVELTSERPLDLHRTLAPLARGPYDPAFRRTPDGALWRTSRATTGPVTYRLEQTGPHGVVAHLWGPGSAEAAATLPDLLGEHDDPTGFAPPETLRETYRQHPGVRIPRTGRVLEALVGAVLDQRVQSVVAFRSWAWLLDHHGDAAPGPGAGAATSDILIPTGMRVVPDAEGWATIPTWDWHQAGVDPGRARTIREAARRARPLEAAVNLPLPEAHARLQALPGIGAWTSAEVARRALGDPDAVSVGDYHLAYAVVWALAGERVPRESHGTAGALTTADRRMLELLAPYAPHRQRVVRLLELAKRHEQPRRGPRLSIQDHRRN